MVGEVFLFGIIWGAISLIAGLLAKLGLFVYGFSTIGVVAGSFAAAA